MPSQDIKSVGGAPLSLTANGYLPVQLQGTTKPTVLLFGRKAVTTAGTRVALVATSTPLVGGYVEITALSSNTGFIYVGDVTVASTNGHRLAAGVSTVIFIDDLNRIYLDASVSGEGVSYQGS